MGDDGVSLLESEIEAKISQLITMIVKDKRSGAALVTNDDKMRDKIAGEIARHSWRASFGFIRRHLVNKQFVLILELVLFVF